MNRLAILVAGVAVVALVATGSSGAGLETPSPAPLALVFGGVDPDTHTVQVYRIAPDGSGLVRTGEAPEPEAWNECPSWSADGARIYFDTFLGGTGAQLLRVNADGTGREAVDQSGAPTRTCPSAGPNERFVYAVEFAGSGGGKIVRLRIGGADVRVIARASRLNSNGNPVYAPSGRQVVFSRVTFNKSGQGIKRADLVVTNGRHNTVITRNRKALFGSASWSPDGQQLVAVRGDLQIVTLRRNGTQVRLLASGSGSYVSSPVFSPDGTKIAYAQCEGDCGDPQNPQGAGSLWVMNADGSDQHRILDQATAGVQPTGKLGWGPTQTG